MPLKDLTLEDLAAIAVALAAAMWLGRSWWRGIATPPCVPPGALPAGADGFVPLERIAAPGESATAPESARAGRRGA